tara:strand:- start:11814 stop:12437 length:624 start_codon:yes stop_codon:yes gene_type:complete
LISSLIFDFDGVILDSVSIKTKTFSKVLENYPNSEVNTLLDFHHKNGGISRGIKFKYFFEVVRGESVSESVIEDLSEQFSKTSLKLLKDKSLLIKEVVEFIRIHHQKMKIFVASGADQKDLRELCNYFDIGQYFQSIRGSPTPKTEIVLDLIKRFSLNPLQTALVGDSINDYEAAFKNNIPFFGYNNTKLKSLKESTYLYSIKDINV